MIQILPLLQALPSQAASWNIQYLDRDIQMMWGYHNPLQTNRTLNITNVTGPRISAAFISYSLEGNE